MPVSVVTVAVVCVCLSLNQLGGGNETSSVGNETSSVGQETIESSGEWGGNSASGEASGVEGWGGNSAESWGSNSLDSNLLLDSDWVRDGVGLLLDDWGLDDPLDLVDWVWGGNGNWGWDLNVVWLRDVLVDNDLPLDWGWDSDGDLDGVLLDVQLGLDPGGLWGDDLVGPGWGHDALNSHGISWGWAKVDWCWWDGGSWGWHWDGWDRQGVGDHLVGGGGLDQAVGRGLGQMAASLNVLVSSLDGPGASWHLPVSNNTVLHVLAGDGWSGMNSLVDGGGSSTVADQTGVSSDQTGMSGDQTSMSSNWKASREQLGGSSAALRLTRICRLPQILLSLGTQRPRHWWSC